ncbi:MAG TPA: hypothetical protein VGB79_14085 [Allosphingosinicella sp.]|jgi:hypothetical protein
MKMHKTMLAALVVAFLLPLAACQAPPLDPRIGAAAREAHDGAMQLVAVAEAGLFADPASFEGAAPRYGALDAQLSEARGLAEAAPPGADPLARRAAALLPRQIEGCRSQLERLAGIHRREGIAPGAGLTGSVAVACDLARRAAAAAR